MSLRFIHYAAALQLFGVGVFQSLMAPAELRRHLDGSSRALALPCAWLLLSSAIALLALMAGTMGEGWADAVNPRCCSWCFAPPPLAPSGSFS